MKSKIKIRSALVSVYDKEGIEPIIKELEREKIIIYSTGGTGQFIEKLGIKYIPIEDITSYPSILGGRVKTLHPKVFGGILNRKNKKGDQKELLDYEIPQIDLVIVDLYPFEETIRATNNENEIIEKIDIGGISLIRAAAKNFNDVLCISDKSNYDDLLKILKNSDAQTTIETRREFAVKAFDISSNYDTAIFNFFNKDNLINSLKISSKNHTPLRYGENPHQNGGFYGDLKKGVLQIHGKQLSYNNLLDIDNAINLISEFKKADPTFAILKHNNACGVSTKKTISLAYKNALMSDPVSAFGGVLISNSEIDSETAKLLKKLFFEVLIAPKFSKMALITLKEKKNLIVLKNNISKKEALNYRSCLNGFLVQENDLKSDSVKNLNFVTKEIPNKAEIDDLIFASKISKHTKSNTIVLAKNSQLLGSGMGQSSRVDALKHAIKKAKNFGFNLKNAVMASDAFFPFPDCVEIANKEGIKCVIQPGGSIKDNLSIDYCNKYKMKMVFTGMRHFKH
jgi:phosphoribosylaminoimidazolecarboxamide formyltransferase/IMP cyclohydrolase